MIVGIRFRNGMQFGLDLGPDVTPQSVALLAGGAIRHIGAKVQSAVKASTDALAAQTVARISSRRRKSK